MKKKQKIVKAHQERPNDLEYIMEQSGAGRDYIYTTLSKLGLKPSFGGGKQASRVESLLDDVMNGKDIKATSLWFTGYNFTKGVKNWLKKRGLK